VNQNADKAGGYQKQNFGTYAGLDCGLFIEKLMKDNKYL
jgi:hypothetical protein